MYQGSIFHRRGTRRIFRSCQKKKKSFAHGEEHRPRVPRPELRAALAALRHGPLAVLPVQGAARRTGRGRGQHCQGTGLAERARRHAGHSLPPRPSWPRRPAQRGPRRGRGRAAHAPGANGVPAVRSVGTRPGKCIHPEGQDTQGSSRDLRLPRRSRGCAVSGGGNSGKRLLPPFPPGVLAEL